MKKEARCKNCGKWIGIDFYGGPDAWIHIYTRNIWCVPGLGDSSSFAWPAPTPSGSIGEAANE